MHFRYFIYFTFFLFLAAPAQAELTPEKAAELTDYRLILASMNEKNPLENPLVESTEELLQRDLQDSTNKVFGEIDDLLINENGKIEMLVTTVEGIGVGKQTLFLSTNEVRTSLGLHAYEIPYHRDEMEDLLPQILAQTETAAGDGNLTSLRSLNGRMVVTPDGKRFAKVKTAITDQQARHIIGLVLANIAGVSGKGEIAVPYDRGLRIENTGFENKIEIDPAFADAVQTFAKE
jgi:sporulation protein YlmC with PRC-barrel domain